MKLLLGWKRFVCWVGLGDHLLEFCERCGRHVGLVWHASDALWLEIVGEPTGVLCTGCFDDECYRRGKFIRWVPCVVRIRLDGDWVPTE
jgi:hypothetical protein